MTHTVTGSHSLERKTGEQYRSILIIAIYEPHLFTNCTTDIVSLIRFFGLQTIKLTKAISRTPEHSPQRLTYAIDVA